MLVEKTKIMMTKSFAKTRYRFRPEPPLRLSSAYGIYVHVPFCRTRCGFCPFYKEIYTDGYKHAYLQALKREIQRKPISGTPTWIYFGGGTPNLLTVSELDGILASFRSKINPHRIGIELLPALVTRDYLRGLKDIGVTKVSLGVESLQTRVLGRSGRAWENPLSIGEIIAAAQSLGLWVNTDLMVGLPGQAAESTLADVREMTRLQPSQVTLYPYMVIRNVKAEAGMTNAQQFQTIEAAGAALEKAGYERKCVWVFARGEDIYDSSRDELVEEYVGFGPAAFSTYGNWKVVNPELDIYLTESDKTAPKVLVAPKTKASDDWRAFARMIYDLKCARRGGMPWFIALFIETLKWAGYAKRGKLTAKGICFAHEITKTVVESLPFPLQNPALIENNAEYLTGKTPVEM